MNREFAAELPCVTIDDDQNKVLKIAIVKNEFGEFMKSAHAHLTATNIAIYFIEHF